jgi:hypothetical protein
MFNRFRRAWERLAAPVNAWLFRRYVRKEIRAGRIKEMMMRETRWQRVMHPSKGEVERTLLGEMTKLITTRPDYSRKKNGKYTDARPRCPECDQVVYAA